MHLSSLPVSITTYAQKEISEDAEHIAKAKLIFSAQKRAFIANKNPDYQARKNHLEQLRQQLHRFQPDIICAIEKDFGQRATSDTLMGDIGQVLQAIRYALKHLKTWMKPQTTSVDLSIWPARAYVQRQPCGVVGVIAPWNFPVQLLLVPLVDALSAGCRVMLKSSELTPHTAAVLQRLLQNIFSDDHVSLLIGGKQLGEAFSQLSFDHLLFTGSEKIGRQVARQAAAQLTPVTLELGGKSPLILEEDFSVNHAAELIGISKCFNAGQTCIAPDYILVPKEKCQALVEAILAWFKKTYGSSLLSSNYTSIISHTEFNRLHGLLQKAEDRGEHIFTSETITPEHKLQKLFPLTLVLDCKPDSNLLKEEIFGPILPVVAYESVEQAISWINSGSQPLATYILSNNVSKGEAVLGSITAGGGSVNTPLLQQTVNSLPFGGIGQSGMGRYHGYSGFCTFSHSKSILVAPAWHPMRMIKPPSGWMYKCFVKLLFRS
jgi:coniferyl-aldehyde dehydrogenase